MKYIRLIEYSFEVTQFEWLLLGEYVGIFAEQCAALFAIFYPFFTSNSFSVFEGKLQYILFLLQCIYFILFLSVSLSIF